MIAFAMTAPPPDPSWTDAERRVWDILLRGGVARLAADALDPGDADAWTPAARDDRRLSAAFIQTLLFDKPYREALPQQGLRIEGAVIEAGPGGIALDFAHAAILPQFWLEASRIEGDVVLTDARCDAWFSLEGSVVTGRLAIDGARLRSLVSLQGTRLGALAGTLLSVEGDLGARGLVVAGDVELGNAAIRGSLAAAEATIGGKHDADGLRASRVILDGATLAQDVVFRGANVSGALELAGATVSGNFDADALAAGRLILGTRDRGGATFHRGLSVTAATIAKDLEAESLTIGSEAAPADFEAGRMIVGGDVWVRDTTLHGEFRAAFADIKGNAWFEACTLSNLALPGARIAGELHIGTGLTWAQGAVLNLRAARVGAIGDVPDAWPRGRGSIKLAGFQYDRLGGFMGDDFSDWVGRDRGWFLDWLGRTSVIHDGQDIGFRAETYERLARALRAIGRHDAADDVLFRAREIARRQATGLRRAGLSLSRWLIGHGLGYGYLNALGIALGLAALGAAIIHIDAWMLGSTVAEKGLLWTFFASLDHLLPIISLDKEFGDQVPVRLIGWAAKLYFWLVGISGWIIGVVLGWGLAGLAQKS